jgi:chromosome segregation ATPase
MGNKIKKLKNQKGSADDQRPTLSVTEDHAYTDVDILRLKVQRLRARLEALEQDLLDLRAEVVDPDDIDKPAKSM